MGRGGGSSSRGGSVGIVITEEKQRLYPPSPQDDDDNGDETDWTATLTKPARSLSSCGRTVDWVNVSVSAPQENRSILSRLRGDRKPRVVKKILHNVSGVARAGRVIAIMGSSGAGKTTLMNVLTGRNLGRLDVTGVVRVDGLPVSAHQMRELCAFVEQDDLFVGTLTVKEHLLFMAKLRMGPLFTKAEREARVLEVMRQMDLEKCANTTIGIPNKIKGISGGERKRLSFASEILTSPQILFCDEPTSGLDAFMAGQVIGALRELAAAGITVLLTIHQPSSQTFQLFDDLCLMALGRIVYLGPRKNAADLFARAGYACPAFFNPADHYVRALAVTEADRAECVRKIAHIREQFANSEQGMRVAQLTANPPSLAKKRQSVWSESGATSSAAGSSSTAALSSFWSQLTAVAWRSWLTVVRDPILMRVRLAQVIITALITGCVYWQTPISAATVLTINGILFNHIRNINFMLQFPSVPIITSELPVVLRETRNGVYEPSAYFLAKNAAETPQFVVLPCLYICIVYWMSGLVPLAAPFLFACLIATLVISTAISISYAVACVFGDTAIAMTYLPLFVVPIMAFGGFFIDVSSIPVYFGWLSKLSYFKYAYEALMANEWSHVDYIPGCEVSNQTVTACPATGAQVVEQASFSLSSQWTDVGILFLMTIAIRLIAYVALALRVRHQR